MNFVNRPVRHLAFARAEENSQATGTLLDSRTIAVGILAVRPGLEVGSLASRGAEPFRGVRCRADVTRCLHVSPILNQPFDNRFMAVE